MEKYITLTDEKEEDKLAEILFTFEYENENFVLLTLVEDIENTSSLEDDYDVLAYKYEELEDGSVGNLIEIPEKSSDWEIVEEMFNTFSSGEFENEE